MIIVSDTSPVTNLIQIDQLGLLKDLFGEIVIPQIVYTELCTISSQKEILENQNWIRVKSLTEVSIKNKILAELDEGEAEAIALAIELKADYLLIDEQKGRSIAEKYGIRITGLLGLLLIAKEKKLIKAIKPVLEKLIYNAGFRINTALYLFILQSAGEE